ncbi:MAG: hypothetical protein B6242_15405 [Anaerolineaceae bacterium 4572_78]|nr:MAG: hypothetical protein B6242_15405 [Anaerolineaceae bacterium 4572_78]
MSSTEPGESDKIEQHLNISGTVKNLVQIGKIVIQSLDSRIVLRLGLEQRLGFFILGILVLLSTFFVYRWFQPDQTMYGDYNIAVAQFQVVGHGEGYDEAKILAQRFSNAIGRKIVEVSTELEQSVEIKPPHETGIVKGETVQSRAVSAQRLADNINAGIVIYGVVSVDGVSASISPEFLIRLDEEEAQSDALEIVGQYRMGNAIIIDKVNNKARQSQASIVVADRVNALTFIVYGLSDYIIGEYRSAEMKFHKALGNHSWSQKDTIYVLLGNAALRQHHFEDAKNYYEKALVENYLYSRAFIGLGSVFYAQSIGDKADDTYKSIDEISLDKSIEYFKIAADPNLEQPFLADITFKSMYGLGQAYLLKANLELARNNIENGVQYLAEAKQAFEVVIAEYEQQRNDRIAELAAHSHARVGLIYRIKSQYTIAIDEYIKAIDILPVLERTKPQISVYQASIAEMYVELGELQEAIVWYTFAVQNVPMEKISKKIEYQNSLKKFTGLYFRSFLNQ